MTLHYRTRKSSHWGLECWNVELQQIIGPRRWRAVGHVKRVMREHYLAFYGGQCLGSTETRRDAIAMIVERARG